MSSQPSADPARRQGVAVLGSTGSIGRQALDVLARLPERFAVVALAAGGNRELLDEQAARVRPRAAVLNGSPEALVELATADEVDLVVVATGGVISLRPILAALEAGKVVATANKETLVAGGHLVMPVARRLAAARTLDVPSMGSPLAWLRPIDSEHSAIWQCLVGEGTDAVAAM